jgi:hypothetical protein
VTQGLNLKEAL